MSEFINEKLSGLKPYVPGERPKSGKSLIKLNTNENPFPPSPKAVKAGRAALNGLNLYNDPDAAELKKALAAVHGVSVQNVTVGNGSDEILAFLFAGFCEKGALINDVTYGFYEIFADMFGVKKTIVPLDKDYTVNIAEYEKKKGTVFIVNPNAPTGINLPLDKIRELAGQDKKRLVVVDEAYVDFGGDSAVKLLDTCRNIVVVGTFSKSRSLAGARLGFAIANREIIADLERVRNSMNPYNINSVTQAMGIAALNDVAYFHKTKTAIIENRAFLTERLVALGFTVLDSRTNFIFAMPPDRDGKRLYGALKDADIIVRYFDAERTKEFCRITIGDKKACLRIVECAEKLYKSR